MGEHVRRRSRERVPTTNRRFRGRTSSGRSRTRTWDLFLIRKTCCPLQSPQLALNPCKPPRRHRRKGTGGDWSLQAGGPIVAPRRRFEGTVSFDPEAVITPTIRSRPEAQEAGRCAPACSSRPRQAARGRARQSRDPLVSMGERAAVTELARDIQSSACHAASTASLACGPRRRRGCEETGAAGELVASQRLRSGPTPAARAAPPEPGQASHNAATTEHPRARPSSSPARRSRPPDRPGTAHSKRPSQPPQQSAPTRATTGGTPH